MDKNSYFVSVQPDLSLCICTYKRPHLLELLIRDILEQILQPRVIIIVDGDPLSKQVLGMLQNLSFPASMSIRYIASNHGNQTYQRFLGWRVAEAVGVKKILYLDDDLRIRQPSAIQNITSPLDWTDKNVVAVTGTLDMGTLKSEDGGLTLEDLRSGLSNESKLISRVGTSRNYPAGDITPAGNRIPVKFSGNPYEAVKWLRGGAFVIRVNSISKDILSDDIFAMNHLEHGLCEDLIISRRLISAGEIMMAFNAIFLHPSEDAPKAYSSNAYHFGVATSYSRKWFNDNYRGFGSPNLRDRIALIKNYIAVLLLNVWRTLISFDKQRALFVYGFFRGIIYSFTREITSDNLTPDIDWWADAEAALLDQKTI